MTSAAKRALSLIAESRENRNPVWVSHTPGLLVELVNRCKRAALSLDGGHYTVCGEDWTVCVVT